MRSAGQKTTSTRTSSVPNPGGVRGAGGGQDYVAGAENALGVVDARPAGPKLFEALLLTRMDVVDAGRPARLADPLDLQRTVGVFGELPKHGAQPDDRVDQLVARPSHHALERP